VDASAELTRDAVSDGALYIYQSKNGYRFGLDAVLLATDLPQLPADPVIYDLGAGHGAVGLMIANRRKDAHVTCVELQFSLFELLKKNVRENGLEGRVHTIRDDVRNHRSGLEAHAADLVVCNPPFYRVGQGRISPIAERAAAHQEMNGTLRDFVAAAQYVAKPGGRLKIILPPLRLADLVEAVGRTDLRGEWMRFVHGRESEDAYLMECVFRRGGAREFHVRPPLYVHDGDAFSSEVRNRFDTAALPDS